MAEALGTYSRILRSTGTYGIGIAVQRGASFLLLPLYTRLLTAADYGILELIDVTMAVFSLVAGTRIAMGVAYFSSAVPQEQRGEAYTTNLIGSFLVGITAAAVGWVLSPWISRLVFGTPNHADVLRLAIGAFAMSLPLESAQSRLQVEDRPGTFVAVGMAKLAAQIFFNVFFLVVLKLGFKAIVWTNLVVNIIFASAMAWLTFRSYGMRFNPRLFVSMLRFTAQVGVVAVSLFVFHAGDRFFLRRYASLDEIGVYSLGYKFGMLISYVQMAFSQYWFPRSYDLLKGEEGQRIFSRVLTYFLTAMLLATTLTWVYAPPVIRLVLPVQFHGCIAFIPIILCAYLIRAVADYMRAVLYTSRNPGRDAAGTLFTALFCLGAYSVLIPLHGAIGAAWATLLTSVVMFLTSLALSYRVFQMSVETGRLAVLIGGAAGAVLLYTLSPLSSVPGQILSASAAALLFGVGVIWLGVMTPFERDSVRQVINRVLPSAG